MEMRDILLRIADAAIGVVRFIVGSVLCIALAVALGATYEYTHEYAYGAVTYITIFAAWYIVTVWLDD